jgi:hypothetical protein
VPVFTVSVRLSVGSATESSTGVTRIVALVTPGARVSVSPLADRVPPVAVTM